MKVSVIVPVHNSRRYLKECLDSIINQTYKNIEIIIINDNSTDDSLKIIKTYNDKRIKLINLDKNSGVALARNKGIEVSTGAYICFIDSDDYWYKDKIEKQVKFIKDKEFIYSNYEFLKNNKVLHHTNVPSSITYNEALKITTIFTSTVMFNMNYLKKEEIYFPNIKRGQDTACWWKVLKKIKCAYGMKDILSIYRVGEKSLSSNKIKALKRTWNLYKMEDISYLKKMYCFMCYVFNAIKRRI